MTPSPTRICRTHGCFQPDTDDALRMCAGCRRAYDLACRRRAYLRRAIAERVADRYPVVDLLTPDQRTSLLAHAAAHVEQLADRGTGSIAALGGQTVSGQPLWLQRAAHDARAENRERLVASLCSADVRMAARARRARRGGRRR